MAGLGGVSTRAVLPTRLACFLSAALLAVVLSSARHLALAKPAGRLVLLLSKAKRTLAAACLLRRRRVAAALPPPCVQVS